MKSAAASLVIAMACFLPLLSAAPTFAPVDEGIVSSVSTSHTLFARKVPQYKTPWSAEGTCNAGGSCDLDKSGSFPVRCKNSKCDKVGSPCTIAYSETGPTVNTGEYRLGMEAKCPINMAGSDWDWPWIDYAWKNASDTYQKCESDAKSIKDKKAKGTALAACDQITGGLA